MSENLNPGLEPEVSKYLQSAAEKALEKKKALETDLAAESARQESEKRQWKSW
jgi:hypothetical protein